MFDLVSRFVGKGGVEHVHAGERRSPTRTPGYVVAGMVGAAIMAATASADAKAAKTPRAPQTVAAEAPQPVVCTLSERARQSSIDQFNSQRTPEGDKAVARAVERLGESKTGRKLLADAKANGVEFIGVPGLTGRMGIQAAFIPELNKAVLDTEKGDNLAHMLGHELYHAQGYHNGTGATVTFLDTAKMTMQQSLSSMVYEESVAWSLQARIAHEIADAGDDSVLDALRASKEFAFLDDIYVQKVGSLGAMAGFRATTEEVRKKFEKEQVYTALYTAAWMNSANCVENQPSAVRPAVAAAAAAHTGVGNAEALMAAIPSKPGALIGGATGSSDSIVLRMPVAQERTPVDPPTAVGADLPPPMHPSISHQASPVAGGWIVREIDPETGTAQRIGNTLGPAISRNGNVAYAIGGEIMPKEAWANHPRVLEANGALGIAPNDDMPPRGPRP